MLLSEGSRDVRGDNLPSVALEWPRGGTKDVDSPIRLEHGVDYFTLARGIGVRLGCFPPSPSVVGAWHLLIKKHAARS